MKWAKGRHRYQLETRGVIIPRGPFDDSRSTEAKSYRRHIENLIAAYGQFQPSAFPLLRESALVDRELRTIAERLEDLDLPRAERRRLEDRRGLLRQHASMFLKRLESLAPKTNGHAATTEADLLSHAQKAMRHDA